MTGVLKNKPLMLVGSVPGETAEQVFLLIGPAIGDLLAGVSDGEPGYRNKWIVFNAPQVFEPNPDLEVLNKPRARPEHSVFKDVPDWVPTSWEDMWRFTVRPGVRATHFGDLPYPGFVRESWPIFQRMRKEGVIPAGARFQVSLPQPEDFTRWCTGNAHDFSIMTRAVEETLARAVKSILATVPAKELVFQWDVCWEVLANATGDCLGREPLAWKAEGDPLERFAGYIRRLSPLVPEEAVLGMHLCYGDLEHTHLIEPPDLANCVRMANEAVQHAGRRFDFVQMPVPRNRNDDAYFKPLRKLRLGEGKLYIGLVHHTDGVAGTLARVRTFRRHYDGDFGVATECGWGRRKSETIPALLQIHREVAAAL
ncbi:MAG: hypothetical protein HYY48_09015 [Gammaproteobacteria bacterium]|nr:hypothetical protein [Gammaproteobacteria bacterium]